MEEELKSYYDQALEALISSGYEIVCSRKSTAGKNPFEPPNFVDLALIKKSSTPLTFNFCIREAVNFVYKGSYVDRLISFSRPDEIIIHHIVENKYACLRLKPNS